MKELNLLQGWDHQDFGQMSLHGIARMLNIPMEDQPAKGGVTKLFPIKLYEMLEQEDEEIVSWLPNGRGLTVFANERFESEVLPKFFKQTKLSSFHRQLNIYGFRRVLKDKPGSSWAHRLFIRGRKDIIPLIQRTPIKGMVSTLRGSFVDETPFRLPNPAPVQVNSSVLDSIPHQESPPQQQQPQRQQQVHQPQHSYPPLAPLALQEQERSLLWEALHSPCPSPSFLEPLPLDKNRPLIPELEPLPIFHGAPTPLMNSFQPVNTMPYSGQMFKVQPSFVTISQGTFL